MYSLVQRLQSLGLRPTILRSTQRSRERGTKSTIRKAEKALTRTKQRLELVERERQALLQQWSLLDSQLHKIRLQQQERREPLPPPFQTLQEFLEHRAQQERRHLADLQAVRELMERTAVPQTATSVDTQKWLPSSMLRQPESTSELNSSSALGQSRRSEAR